MARLGLLFLLLGALIALVSATAPTFCKCTCFKNSTIILLGPPAPRAVSSGPGVAVPAIAPRSASASCTQCTKAFCLDNRIPFCADATEQDVTTQCFQRDSAKDKIIVWGFMLGTSALMGYAAYKKIAERRDQADGGVFPTERAGYTVLGQDTSVMPPSAA